MLRPLQWPASLSLSCCPCLVSLAYLWLSALRDKSSLSCREGHREGRNSGCPNIACGGHQECGRLGSCGARGHLLGNHGCHANGPLCVTAASSEKQYATHGARNQCEDAMQVARSCNMRDRCKAWMAAIAGQLPDGLGKSLKNRHGRERLKQALEHGLQAETFVKFARVEAMMESCPASLPSHSVGLRSWARFADKREAPATYCWRPGSMVHDLLRGRGLQQLSHGRKLWLSTHWASFSAHVPSWHQACAESSEGQGAGQERPHVRASKSSETCLINAAWWMRRGSSFLPVPACLHAESPLWGTTTVNGNPRRAPITARRQTLGHGNHKRRPDMCATCRTQEPAKRESDCQEKCSCLQDRRLCPVHVLGLWIGAFEVGDAHLLFSTAKQTPDVAWAFVEAGVANAVDYALHISNVGTPRICSRMARAWTASC